MPRIGKSIEEILLSRSLGVSSASSFPQSGGIGRQQQGHSAGTSMSRGEIPDQNSTTNHINSDSRATSHGSSLVLSKTSRAQTSTSLRSRGSRESVENLKRIESDKITMESLMDHSRLLQLQVKELQSKLLQSEHLISSLKYELETSRMHAHERYGLSSKPVLGSSQGVRTSSAPSHQPQTISPLTIAVPSRPHSHYENSPIKTMHRSPKSSHGPSRRGSTILPSPYGNGGGHDLGKFSHTIDHMDEQLAELKYLFRPVDPLVERQLSALKIQSMVRRWICQKKYNRYWASLASWRTGRAQSYLPILERGLYRSSRVSSTIQSLHIKKSSKLLKSIFDRWVHICKQSAPFRRSMLVAAEEKYRAKIFMFKLEYFLAFKNGTLGSDSHKQLRKERRLLIERIKHNLQAKIAADGIIGMLVSDEDIKRGVYREIVSQSNSKRQGRNLRIVFETFRSLYIQAKKYRAIANQHQFKKYAGRCFYSWSDWTYQVGTGLERKRWAGPRKYEVRYNQKLVEHFSKVRLKKMTFAPWKVYTKRSKRVNYMFTKKLSDFLKANLLGWKNITMKNKRLRQETISNWSGYAVLIMSTPFAAWKEFASTASIRRMHQNSLVTAYVRWKTRQKHIRILRLWRHQSLYGGIEGMYSRTTISKSLGEQKGMTAALQKMLTKQTIELEECKELVHKETTTRKKMEDKVAEKDVELEKLKIRNHHFDMELKRLYGIIDAMSRINPRHVQYIKDMQPDFEFHERKIQPSLDVASSEDLFKVENEGDEESAESGTKSKSSKHTEISRSLSGGAPSSSQSKGRPSVQHAEEVRFDSRLSHRSSNASNSRLTLAVPQSHGQAPPPSNNIGNATPGGGGGVGLSNEDRRLLTRAKWLLRRLLDPDDEPYDPLHPEPIDDEEDLDGETRWKKENKRKKSEKKYHTIENVLKDILNDEVKKRETLFVLNILSFLKDGNAKCLSDADSRSWAQELLQSVGRSTDLVSTIMGNTNKSGNMIETSGGRRSSITTDPDVDMDTWRSVLVHMRAHYPVGMAAKSAHVHYQDESDPLQTGILKRIETMKSDLVDIIQLKEEKIHSSKTGKILESTMMLKDTIPSSSATTTVMPSSTSTSALADALSLSSTIKEDEDNVIIPKLKVPAVNLYAENILNQPGKARGGGTIFEEEEEEEEKDTGGEEEEDLKQYDDIQLTKDPQNYQQSHVLSLQQSLVDTISSSGKSVEYDDEFVIDKAKKEEEDRERDRARLRDRRKAQN